MHIFQKTDRQHAVMTRNHLFSPFPRLLMALFAVGAVLIAGCASGPNKLDEYLKSGSLYRPDGTIKSAEEIEMEINARTSPEALEERKKPILIPGSGQILATPRPTRQVALQGDEVTLEFANAPLGEVTQALLGDLLGVTYVVEFMPQGTVSLRTGTAVTKEAVLPIVESILQTYGAALVKDAQGVYHITQLTNAAQYTSRLYRDGALPPGFSLVVVPLSYIGAEEMAHILQPVAPEGTIVTVDPIRNLLVLAGNQGQHEGWMDIVHTFDVDYLRGMSLAIFPLEYASVDDVYDILNRMLSGKDLSSSTGGQPPQALGGRQSGMAGGRQSSLPGGGAAGASLLGGDNSELKGAALSGTLRVYPLTRLNSLVAVSAGEAHLQTLQHWLTALDQPDFDNLEPGVYVYQVQNGSALHLADLLGSLFSGAMGDTGSSDSGIAPGLNQNSLGGGRNSGFGTNNTSSGSFNSSSSSGNTVAMPDSGPSEAMSSQVVLGDQVRVVADRRSNSLVIRAPRKDFRKIERALRHLDRAPMQVLIEASIVEVQLKGSLSYGLEWAFNNSIGSHTGGGNTNWGNNATGGNIKGIGGTGNQNINSGNGNGKGNINLGEFSLGQGFSYLITNGRGDIRAMMNMLASNSLISVLSSPSVLVQDNYTAAIHVGSQQPYLRGTTQNEVGTTQNTELKDIGVMLSVTPSVNASGMVSMEIDQQVSSLGTVEETIQQRSFNQRHIKSQVTVRSGETIVMGGLITDNGENSRSGIPKLHDIPLLGNLFGSTSENTDRTELVVMITPHVLGNDEELRAIGGEMRERMRQTLQSPVARRAIAPERRRISPSQP